jgi:hypothetical protein
MNEYRKKDEKGRDIFKTFCSNQQWCTFKKNSKDDYAKWDNAYLSGDTKMVGEIKYRTEYNSTSFGDWILEVDKLESLQKLQRKMQAKGVKTTITYINHFKDGKTLIWDLTDLDISQLEIKKLWLQKNDFDSTMVWKNVVFLHKNEVIFKD